MKVARLARDAVLQALDRPLITLLECRCYRVRFCTGQPRLSCACGVTQIVALVELREECIPDRSSDMAL